MKKIRAVLFDMDGLMFDTQRLWDKAWKQAGEACGVPMGEEQIAPLRGRSLADSRAAFEKNVAPGDVFDRCNTMADALVREWLRGDVPMKPGLLPLLAYLQKTGRAMAVVSSTEQNLVKDLLQRTSILNYFSAVVCGDMVRHSKPAPDIYLLGAQRVNVPPAHCLVLEDSENGARAGLAAGCRTVVVPDVAPVAQQVLAAAAAVVPSLEDVITLLEEDEKTQK